MDDLERPFVVDADYYLDRAIERLIGISVAKSVCVRAGLHGIADAVLWFVN